MTGAMWVLLVPIIVWAGVFTYILMLERKLAAIEVGIGEDEE